MKAHIALKARAVGVALGDLAAALREVATPAQAIEVMHAADAASDAVARMVAAIDGSERFGSSLPSETATVTVTDVETLRAERDRAREDLARALAVVRGLSEVLDERQPRKPPSPTCFMERCTGCVVCATERRAQGT